MAGSAAAAQAAVEKHRDSIKNGAPLELEEEKPPPPPTPALPPEEPEELDDTMEWILPFQEKVYNSYQGTVVQVGVAVLICVNFLVSAVNAEVLPEPDDPATFVFLVFEWFFGIAFLIELIWNIWGSWWRPFIASAWNWFDFIIVSISLLALMFEDMPGISVLRLFRAFRVFRLFKRVESLRIIIEGVAASLPGVMNAFLVLGILMGIWSIMGVEFFRAHADQEFGSFFRAMFSMWQVMSMDSWASGIARPLIYDHGHSVVGPIFFISYTFIAGIVMTNVVVAILLEKYLETTQRIHDEKKAEKAKLEAAKSEALAKDEAQNSGKAKDPLAAVDQLTLLTIIHEAIMDTRMRKLPKAALMSLCVDITRNAVTDNTSAEIKALMVKKAGDNSEIVQNWLDHEALKA